MRAPATAHWRTELLELFLLEPGHATEEYLEWLNDPDVNRYLESRFVTHDIPSVQAFIASALSDPNVLFLGIRARDTGHHVGNLKLVIDPHHGLGEVGILIGDRRVWGRGLASRAIDCLAGAATHELGLRRLTAGCYRSNEGSVRAFQKAGFHVEAVRPAHFLLDGKPEDFILMARHLDAQL